MPLSVLLQVLAGAAGLALELVWCFAYLRRIEPRTLRAASRKIGIPVRRVGSHWRAEPGGEKLTGLWVTLLEAASLLFLLVLPSVLILAVTLLLGVAIAG